MDSSNSAVLRALLASLAWVVGAEVTGKLFVFGLLFAAAGLSFRAAPANGFVARATGSTIYLANPFVYGRLHYGQLFLLAGYATLPWVALRLRSLLTKPNAASTSHAIVALAVLGALSPHLFLAVGVVMFSLVVAYAIAARSDIVHMKRVGLRLSLVVMATLTLNSYWLAPALAGRGMEGGLITGIGAGDVYAFAAIPDEHLGLVPNLLGLYGFWAEASDRFTPMKAFVPGWPVVLSLLLILCGIGAFAASRKHREDVSPWVASLLAIGLIALVLEMGVSHPLTANVALWLESHVPPYRGMRDAGKWAALLALAYSQLASLGAAATLDWLMNRMAGPPRSELIASAAAGMLLAIPLYYGNGLLYGAHGEIRPSLYPAGWYAADRLLLSDTHPGRTLFLPWHEYMSFGFIRNQNRVVAPPGPTFFSVPILVSTDPEVPGIIPTRSEDQDAISSLVAAGSGGEWAQVLNERHIKYVLLARELDWTYFKFLDDQPGLTRVGDFGSIILYRNDLVS